MEKAHRRQMKYLIAAFKAASGDMETFQIREIGKTIGFDPLASEEAFNALSSAGYVDREGACGIKVIGEYVSPEQKAKEERDWHTGYLLPEGREAARNYKYDRRELWKNRIGSYFLGVVTGVLFPLLVEWLKVSNGNHPGK